MVPAVPFVFITYLLSSQFQEAISHQWPTGFSKRFPIPFGKLAHDPGFLCQSQQPSIGLFGQAGLFVQAIRHETETLCRLGVSILGSKCSSLSSIISHKATSTKEKGQ